MTLTVNIKIFGTPFESDTTLVTVVSPTKNRDPEGGDICVVYGVFVVGLDTVQ